MITANCRTYLLLVLLFSCTLSVSHAQQSPQAIFDRANNELNDGNYSKALSLYKTLEAQNDYSGALFLNMGIAYQRIDSLGMSKYYLFKASRFEETEEKAIKSLEFLESQFSHQSAVLPKFPWDVATDWLRHNIGASTILLIGIIFLNLGILAFVSHWFFDWYPNYLRLSGLSTLILSLLLITCSFYTDYVSNRYSKAVMVTDKVPVVEQPDNNAPLVSQAFEGYTFTVDHYRSQSTEGWSYVRMSNGLYGWIPNSEIRIL
ncbi:SH3 domain-containing protein [Fodinibius halophilus]|uniref:SH3 domain-containing protein n=1 Tax=Fodinibius halophilus TaxID=1736908 RepID=A0A6M1SU20_9BACT|nr:SH3 domain-containing protein [Fodinibius halophilus]NGP87438.1 hypothetical protein [Fodinibius halophilus]